MKKKNRTLTILGTVTVLALTILIVSTLKKDETTEVTIEKPTLGTIVETIPANGRIQPVVEVKMSPDVSGEIVELNCQEGDEVIKGDLLIKIRQDVYISAVQRAEASLNSTKAQYQQQKAKMTRAELQMKRYVALYADSVISRSEYENALMEYEMEKECFNAAGYVVKSDEATLKEMNEQLEKTVIYAPMTGIVSKVMVEKGERVVGTSQMAGTELLRIADFENIEVIVDVNENDIVKINPGDSVSLNVDAYTGTEFSGRITGIANSATSTYAEQVTNFKVKIGIIPESYSNLLKANSIPFRPGMSASATIFTDKVENVVTVPLQSVFYRNGEELVWVVDENGRVGERRVVTGIQDLYRIEIRSGLDLTDAIVTGPYSAISKELNEGMTVTDKK